LAEPVEHPFRSIEVADRTSWSCHHGVLRWTAECPCVPDGRWKGPLRAALERLAAGIDAATDGIAASLAGAPDPWAARDDYVEVVIGAEEPDAFAGRWLGADGGGTDREMFLALMEAQRWRLAMFASDGWYWDDPSRPETAAVLRSAACAVRLIDGITGSRLEGRLVADLGLLDSPGYGIDGAELYRRALAAVGQAGPADAPRRKGRIS
jgi:hypothetical protein